MNGEHGMWRKSSLYEASAKVPLQMVYPGHIPAGRRIDEVVSLVDLVATIVELAGAPRQGPLDGDSLLGLLQGRDAHWKDQAFSEYLAHGVARPTAMLRRDRYKLHYSLGDPPQLYDVEADPNEFDDLAGQPAHAAPLADLQERLLSAWDPVALDRQVRQSQQDRLLIERAARLD